jgi:hypothetical protein
MRHLRNTSKLLRGLALAMPLSLVLWVGLGLAGLYLADEIRPGFKHAFKVKVYQTAGLTRFIE